MGSIVPSMGGSFHVYLFSCTWFVEPYVLPYIVIVDSVPKTTPISFPDWFGNETTVTDYVVKWILWFYSP